MAKNIFSGLLNPEYNPGRNAFDLSHRKVFSCKAGELTPVLVEDVVPGDYFELDTATLLRTLPLQTAAFMRAKMVFDFFFVPKNILWHNFESFIAQRSDPYSSNAKGSLYEPNITITQLKNFASAAATFSPVDSEQTRYRLLNMLGYGKLKDVSDPSVTSRSYSALRIAAYNHIFNDVYRNPWRDEPTSGNHAVQNMNLDDIACDSYSTSLITHEGNRDDGFVKMHYRGYKKDIFMGSLPSQQFGSVSAVSSPLPDVRLRSFSQTNASVSINDSGFLVANGQANFHLYDRNGATPVFSSFDVLQLRRAMALQKWKEYNMRAGYRYHNQQRAMFGVSPRFSNDDHVEFIDSYDAPISVDEVVSQNGSADGNLGEIGGKGIGFANGKQIKYKVSDHGFIFCIMSIVPEVEYDSLMPDRQVVRSEPFDHYVPAFDNLGMTPIHSYDLRGLNGNSQYIDSVLGYAPSYWEYKTRVDKVYDEFMQGLSTPGSLASWVSTRRDLSAVINADGQIPLQYYYINPKILDNIFAMNADDKDDTNQFLVNLNFSITAVRPMSVLGLPSF